MKTSIIARHSAVKSGLTSSSGTGGTCSAVGSALASGLGAASSPDLLRLRGPSSSPLSRLRDRLTPRGASAEAAGGGVCFEGDAGAAADGVPVRCRFAARSSSSVGSSGAERFLLDRVDDAALMDRVD